ncbi:MAG: hypothetical protein ACT4NJ_07930 [Nitrosopumilaceae archaeon]
MKYFVIFLILIGYFGLAFADEPPMFPGKLNPSPYDLWDENQIILDGTIIGSMPHKTHPVTLQYEIKVNEYFKPQEKSFQLITAITNDTFTYFEPNTRALFYLKQVKDTYKVSIYSVKTTPNCGARDLIQISPVLPNDDAFVRGPSAVAWDYRDPCVPNYYSYDPDFWTFREYKPPLRQYNDHYLPIHMQKCGGENVPVTPKSHPNRIACVKPSTSDKLVNMGWATVHSCVNSWFVQPGKDRLTCLCREDEFRKLGGYYVPEDSPLELGMIQTIVRNGQHGVEVELNNPTEFSQYAYVYADCEL